MRQIVLLRGINIGAHNRIAMPQLRELLAAAGFQRVSTYLQSGNVVMSADASPTELASECERQIAAAFGLVVAVVVRTRDDLAEVVRRNPLRAVAVDPKRYQVTFCATAPDAEVAGRLARLAAPGEQLIADGRELYAWHPDGVGRSRLATSLAKRTLGVAATARNWTTVTELLAIADS